MYVPVGKAKYWPTIESVGRSLPLLIENQLWELEEAGRCYAAGRNTACIFHLMRGTEHGLRMLARRLRVKLTNKKQFMPIEFGDLNTIITAVRNKICAARKLALGPKRQAQLERYSTIADRCEDMKEIWRNNLAHARKPYNEQQALDALGKVLSFMQTVGIALDKRSSSL